MLHASRHHPRDISLCLEVDYAIGAGENRGLEDVGLLVNRGGRDLVCSSGCHFRPRLESRRGWRGSRLTVAEGGLCGGDRNMTHLKMGFR